MHPNTLKSSMKFHCLKNNSKPLVTKAHHNQAPLSPPILPSTPFFQFKSVIAQQLMQPEGPSPVTWTLMLTIQILPLFYKLANKKSTSMDQLRQFYNEIEE